MLSLAAHTARFALVGLLTSEPHVATAFSPMHSNCVLQIRLPRQWLTRKRRAFPLGYSGGAVPGLHRSSLFVGRNSNVRPTTNALRAMYQLKNGLQERGFQRLHDQP
jgi:hypothetical protein